MAEKTAGSFTAGVCVTCHRICDTGRPDACLGVIPGVSHACCGHGEVDHAYVVLGGAPGQDCLTIPHTVALYGADAEAFFALIQQGETTRLGETA
jgi:hypothetical protein